MQATDFKPIQANQRIVIIDILRGWALLGVVLMNYQDFFFMGASQPKISSISNILLWISSIVFAAKSWTLLSFLFGYGFAVLMKNTTDKGIHSTKFFARRMFWLFVLAIINSAFFYGDILKDYAVLGLVLLLFNRCSAKTAFRLSVALLVITPFVDAYVSSMGNGVYADPLLPYYPLYKSHSLLNTLWFGIVGTIHGEVLNLVYLVTVHLVMFCCFLLGLAAQKFDFFGNLRLNKKIVKRIFWISLAVVLSLYAFLFSTTGKQFNIFYNSVHLHFLVVLSTMLFIASALCWFYLAGKLKTFFIAMQSIGKMTLTNYMVQNILGLFLFSGFGLGFGLSNKLSLGYYYFFALLIYILQVHFSKWWLARYNYGPVEWLWRQLSYGKRLPIRRD